MGGGLLFWWQGGVLCVIPCQFWTRVINWKEKKKLWTKKQFNISIPTCYIVGILPFYLSLHHSACLTSCFCEYIKDMYLQHQTFISFKNRYKILLLRWFNFRHPIAWIKVDFLDHEIARRRHQQHKGNHVSEIYLSTYIYHQLQSSERIFSDADGVISNKIDCC